jgi:hypothetical protein
MNYATTSLTQHGKEKVEIDPYSSTNIILATGGNKCQAHKMSHNRGTLQVPCHHYQCIWQNWIASLAAPRPEFELEVKLKELDSIPPTILQQELRSLSTSTCLDMSDEYPTTNSEAMV